MNPEIIKPRYEMQSYDGQTIRCKTITREEALAADPQSVDHFRSYVANIWGYRTPDGRWIEHNGDWKGLGDTCLKIITTVQLWPGEYQGPEEIRYLTDVYSLKTPNNLSARWAAIRRAHNETGRKPNFFLTRRNGGYGIAWNPQRSWMVVARVPVFSEKA